MPVDGFHTLPENIADMGGVKVCVVSLNANPRQETANSDEPLNKTGTLNAERENPNTGSAGGIHAMES